jgi:hypothetical protein
VYFHGPATDWAEKIAEREVIARHEVPFLWLARLKAKSIMDGLNRGRCGYVLLRGDTELEKHEASDIDLGNVSHSTDLPGVDIAGIIQRSARETEERIVSGLRNGRY